MDFPTSSQWETFAEWSKTFGEVMSLELLGTRMIVLDSLNATIDLLEKRSSAYSDRPHMPMLIDFIGFHWALPIMPYGRKWRQYRRASHQMFNSRAVETFIPVQMKATHQLLRNLLKTPEDFLSHIKLSMISTAIEIAYGFEVKTHDDKYVIMAEEVMESIDAATVPGAFLVDVIPMLKHIPSWAPGGGFKVKAQRWRKAAHDFFTIPFNDALDLKNNEKSVVASMMQTLGKSDMGEDNDIISAIAANIYVAGSHTTESSLGIFMLAMVLYPDAQKAAQQELDRHFRNLQRLPALADWDSLPYVDALLKEILRWIPTAPLALPHAVTEDDEYAGYFIPKGSIVIGNTW